MKYYFLLKLIKNGRFMSQKLCQNDKLRNFLSLAKIDLYKLLLFYFLVLYNVAHTSLPSLLYQAIVNL